MRAARAATLHPRRARAARPRCTATPPRCTCTTAALHCHTPALHVHHGRAALPHPRAACAHGRAALPHPRAARAPRPRCTATPLRCTCTTAALHCHIPALHVHHGRAARSHPLPDAERGSARRNNAAGHVCHSRVWGGTTERCTSVRGVGTGGGGEFATSQFVSRPQAVKQKTLILLAQLEVSGEDRALPRRRQNHGFEPSRPSPYCL